MTVYLDSSIILRRLLGQAGALREWRLVRTGVSSRITEVECLRTLDRLRLDAELDEKKVSAIRATLYAVLASLEVVEVTRALLTRAAQPSATSRALWTRSTWRLRSSGASATERASRSRPTTRRWRSARAPTDSAPSALEPPAV